MPEHRLFSANLAPSPMHLCWFDHVFQQHEEFIQPHEPCHIQPYPWCHHWNQSRPLLQNHSTTTKIVVLCHNQAQEYSILAITGYGTCLIHVYRKEGSPISFPDNHNTGSEIKDRPLVRDYQIVPRTSKYYNSVVRWTTEFIRNFSGTTWCYKS